MEKAMFFQSKNGKAICGLCPHNCVLSNDDYGLCHSRVAKDSVLYSDNYGKICSLIFDPVEKKPLYHYNPGKTILSVGTTGCNLSCSFCQNYEISQSKARDISIMHSISPTQIIETASKRHDNAAIAFTFNEPIIAYEFVYETAKLALENNIKSVMVSNAYINRAPLRELTKLINAWNIDLKSFDDNFYKKYCNGSLKPVLESLAEIKKSGAHLEVTSLIIPGLNDDEKLFREMIAWIAETLGKETVLHINRYSPRYKMDIPQTPGSTLERLYQIASDQLHYVYIGNVSMEKGRNTLCHKCGNLLINRKAYVIFTEGLDKEGRCRKCGQKSVVINN